MRSLALAVVFGALALTGGCHTPIPVDQPVLGATVVDEKTLIVAEAANYGALMAAEAAVDQGLLKGTQAATVRDYLKGAHDGLLLAREAYKLGDAASVIAKVSAAQSLIAKAWAIIPRKG